MEVVGCVASVSQLVIYTAASVASLGKLWDVLRCQNSSYRTEETNIQILLCACYNVSTCNAKADDPIFPILLNIFDTARRLLRSLEPRTRFGINWTPITENEKIRSAFRVLEQQTVLLQLWYSRSHYDALVDLRNTIAKSVTVTALEVSQPRGNTTETKMVLELEGPNLTTATLTTTPTDTSNDHPTNAPRVGAIISSITDTAVHTRDDLYRGHDFPLQSEASPLDEDIPPDGVKSDPPVVSVSNDPVLTNEASQPREPSIGHTHDQITTHAEPLGHSKLPDGRRDNEGIQSERLEVLAPSIGVHANIQSHDVAHSTLTDAGSQMAQDEDREPLNSAVSPAGPDVLDHLLLQVLLLKEVRTGRGRRRALLQQLLVRALARTGVGN